MKRVYQNEAIRFDCLIHLADDTQFSTRDTHGRLAKIITHSSPKERHDSSVTQPAKTQ